MAASAIRRRALSRARALTLLPSKIYSQMRGLASPFLAAKSAGHKTGDTGSLCRRLFKYSAFKRVGDPAATGQGLSLIPFGAKKENRYEEDAPVSLRTAACVPDLPRFLTAAWEGDAVVSIEKCNVCHKTLSLHGSNRTDNIDQSLGCHNPNNTDISRRPANPANALNGKKEEAIDF